MSPRGIDELERLARELRHSERRYRSLVDNAPDAIMVFDVTHGGFSDANARAVELLGLDPARMGELSPADISPPAQPDGRSSPEAAADWLARTLAGERPVFEWIHRHADGHDFPTEVRLVRMPDVDRIAVRASIQDITERHAARREMQACSERCRAIASGDLRQIRDQLLAATEQVRGVRAAKRLRAIADELDRAVDALVAELDAHGGH